MKTTNLASGSQDSLCLHGQNRTVNVAPLRLPVAIGLAVLAHFGAQVLVGVWLAVSWVIYAVTQASCAPSWEGVAGLWQTPAAKTMRVLIQPVASLGLPDGVWRNPFTAFLLAASNSLVCGIFFGVLIYAVWSVLPRGRRPAVVAVDASFLTTPVARPVVTRAVKASRSFPICTLLWTVSLAAALMGTTGCGTFSRQDVKRGEVMFAGKTSTYPAMTFDLGGAGRGAWFLVLDTPISLATDTVLLPYDLATKK